MKYLLLAFCLLFSSQVYGQKKGKRKSKVKPKYFLNLQGGLLIDKSYDLTYTGFNLINFGYSKIKNNRQQSLQLELIGYGIDKGTHEELSYSDYIEDLLGLESTAVAISSYFIAASSTSTKRRSIELLYNYSFGLTDISNGFFMGPSGSLLYNFNEKIPAIVSSFPVSQSCLCLGIGMNTGYNWSLNKNLMLGISSRVTLLDIGWQKTLVKYPSFTVRQQRSSKFQTDFIRNQFQLNIGLYFKI